MSMIKTTIDSMEIEVERDCWAIEAARRLGISIPSLCHHPALEPYGACRLCVVEVTKGKWTYLTTSCDLPIREGLTIRTDTPAVIQAWKLAIELIWASVPDCDQIASLAERMGVEKPRFPLRREAGDCILCGLCVRACQKVLGAPAIGFSSRGITRSVGPPFDESSETCIGCQACLAVCPTGHVRVRLDDMFCRMETWNTELEMVKCEQCGQPVAPAKQMEYIRRKLPQHVWPDNLCPQCRRIHSASAFNESGNLINSVNQTGD